MNRREMFQATVSHQEPERVLVDYGKHIGSFHKDAYAKLKAYLNIETETKILDRMAQNVVLDEVICQRLGIDFRWIVPKWVGVRDVEVDGAKGYIDMWQTPHKFTDVGRYYAIHSQPLGQENLTLEDIEAFDWPDPHQPDMFEGLREQAQYWYENTDYIVGADGIKVGILQTSSQIRGYDKLFMDFARKPEIAHALLDKISGLINEMYREYMRAVGPYVQVVCITDDQGTQNSLLVSPQMFREFIKPRLKTQIEAIKSTADVKVLMHCDGAIHSIIGDLAEIGVDIINPIQTVVKGLDDTYALKEEFGDRICFHGAIDVQQVLPNATVEEVRQEVARRIYDLGRGGGFIIAPTHNINVDIPVENVVAMFEAAHEYGRYPLSPDLIAQPAAAKEWQAVATEEGGTIAIAHPEQDRQLAEIARYVMEGNENGVVHLVEEMLASDYDAALILKQGMIPGMEQIGALFEQGEAFVPEMLLSANAMQAGVEILRPYLVAAKVEPVGRVILGTVRGDLHDIGKSLVGMMFEGAGFEVFDLGIDVKPAEFVDAVRKHQPDVIGMSALLTTTMPQMGQTIEALQTAGLRDQVCVIIGGAPVTQRFADEIGADLYAKDGSAGARRCKEFLGID